MSFHQFTIFESKKRTMIYITNGLPLAKGVTKPSFYPFKKAALYPIEEFLSPY
jgi:hypothetical protein